MVHLKVYEGQEKIEVLELTEEIVSIGRDPESTLVLPDPSVSRHHAQIEPKGNFYLIRDLASTNGTFVNEMLVRLQILSHGDTLRVGKYLIRVDASHSVISDTTKVRVEKLHIPTGQGYSGEALATLVTGTRGEAVNDGSRGLTRLDEIYREIGYVDTTTSLLERSLDIILEDLDAHRGSFLLFPDSTADRGELADCSREMVPVMPEPAVVRTRNPGSGSAASEELVIPQEFLQEACRSQECVELAPSRKPDGATSRVSSLACPVRDRFSLKAVVYVERQEDQPPFTAEDRHFLTALSSQIAISLTNSQLFAETTAVQAKVKEIFTSLTDGVLVTDPGFRIVEANTAATALLEVVRKNVLGRELSELLEKFDVTPAMNVVEACSPRGKRIFNVATRTGDRDAGDLDPKIDRVLAATIKPFPREAETPAGYVITLRDRSDSWRMEQLKSQFIENVAHKLRTPLTVIEANIPLLRDEAGTSPGDRASLLGEIERNSTILCRIVDRFVDFTELDSAQNLSPIAPDSVSLKKLVHDVILSVQDDARARGVQIEERGAEDLPLIAGYQGRLSTAFANVLDNAIKFSGRGDQVLVQLRSDQSYVRLDVLDNGPGIPPTEIESVFYIGHQIDADNTGQMPGTGLGLVIARHIVQEHGGEVTITSPRDDGDRGTCVTMLLPQLTPERVHANPNGIAGQFSFDPGTCQKEGSL